MYLTVTSEDVCWSIRNVKYINESFYNMRCPVMFITAVCLIFLVFALFSTTVMALSVCLIVGTTHFKTGSLQ